MQDRTLRYTEWTVALLLTALAVKLHITFLMHAGALWRDEASTVWLAMRPTLKEVWQWLPHDHCPIMIHIAIRVWWLLGLASSDFHLRILGLVVGLMLPPAYWIAAYATYRRPPVLPLALVCINTAIISVGDSFRGYGLGTIFSVIVFVAMWRLVRTYTFANALIAAVVAVLAVQSLYQNAIVVLAVCCGGASIFLLHRRWDGVLIVLGVGVLAAASLFPYVELIRRAQEWYLLEKAGFHWSMAWRHISNATGYPMHAITWIWIALFAAAFMISGTSVYRRCLGSGQNDNGDLAIFAGLSMVIGIAAFAVFLKISDLPTQVWYYTMMMAFVSVCLDAIIATNRQWNRFLLVFIAASIGIATVGSDMSALKTRQTNVDNLAMYLNRETSASDYIVVHPWYNGVTFTRYYSGAAPWTTLPQLEDHYLHRYDLLKVELQKEGPIEPVVRRIATTLQTGHRIWLVGNIPLDGKLPPDIRPAPHNPWGWFDEPYSMVWGRQVGYFISKHAKNLNIVIPRSPRGVNMFENLEVVVAAGWRP
ncbi:MAG TPA: hypothetical protein P5103_04915 [Thermovirgaceae bacterium]|nr:hypothetical protein [Thermovirgaceae bacterium]